MTLNIFTFPDTIGPADRVRSVLNNVVGSIRNSEHYPAGVFDSMKVAVVPNETYFLVQNIRTGRRSLSPRFTYEMAALVVRGLRIWLTTYAGTENWPLIWAGAVLDGKIIGRLDFELRPTIATFSTLPMISMNAQSSVVEAV